MMIKKKSQGTYLVLGTAVAIVAIVASFTGCRDDRDILLDKLAALESERYGDRDMSKRTIDDLLNGIGLLESEVERTVDAGEYLGTYYKLVAIRFMDQDMFGLAAEYFRKALTIYPQNSFISYRAGVCTAQLAQAEANPSARNDLVAIAKAHYEHALEVNPVYVDALYGLSVLYVFELRQHADAEPLLDRILQKESRHFRAMFLRAHIHVYFGEIEDAVALYDEIVAQSNDQEMVSQARDNIKQLAGGGE